MWHGTVDMPRVDFVAITAAYNWEPYLALMPVTAMEGDLAAGGMSVGLGPISPFFATSAGVNVWIFDTSVKEARVKRDTQKPSVRTFFTYCSQLTLVGFARVV
jgi:hypothetical protein